MNPQNLKKQLELRRRPFYIRKTTKEYYTFLSNLSEVDKAWLAGLVLGEGTIAVYTHSYTKKGYRVLKGRIAIFNTDLAIIKKAAELLDLKIRKRDPRDKRKYGISSTKPLYEVEALCGKAYYICKILKPYLIGEKLKKAEEVIELYEQWI